MAARRSREVIGAMSVWMLTACLDVLPVETDRSTTSSGGATSSSSGHNSNSSPTVSSTSGDSSSMSASSSSATGGTGGATSSSSLPGASTSSSSSASSSSSTGGATSSSSGHSPNSSSSSSSSSGSVPTGPLVGLRCQTNANAAPQFRERGVEITLRPINGTTTISAVAFGGVPMDICELINYATGDMGQFRVGCRASSDGIVTIHTVDGFGTLTATIDHNGTDSNRSPDWVRFQLVDGQDCCARPNGSFLQVARHGADAVCPL